MSAVTRTEKQLASGLWRIDREHSAIEFRVKQLMIDNVRGRFLDFVSAIEAREGVAVTATIRAASIETYQPERDAHLRSADFLDAEHYPAILFESTAVDLADDGVVAVSGELTIKGRTRPVKLVGFCRGGAGLDGTERL